MFNHHFPWWNHLPPENVHLPVTPVLIEAGLPGHATRMGFRTECLYENHELEWGKTIPQYGSFQLFPWQVPAHIEIIYRPFLHGQFYSTNSKNRKGSRLRYLHSTKTIRIIWPNLGMPRQNVLDHVRFWQRIGHAQFQSIIYIYILCIYIYIYTLSSNIYD